MTAIPVYHHLYKDIPGGREHITFTVKGESVEITIWNPYWLHETSRCMTVDVQTARSIYAGYKRHGFTDVKPSEREN